MKIALIAASLVVLGGCDQLNRTAIDPQLLAAQRAALEHPINRFVVAGTRQFPNGTEVYVLDGQTGQVCYYFVATGAETGPKAAKTDMRGCAGDALAPNF